MANESPSETESERGRRRRYAMVDSWQPLPLLLHLVAVIVASCAVLSLPLQLVGAAAGCLLLLQVGGLREARVIVAACGFGALVSVLAPLFDASGSSVMFTLFGRPYTQEALLRGALTGALVSNMILWFACMGRICGSDGLLRSCGRCAPRIGMVTSLVVQMVPRFAHRIARVRSARAGAHLVGDCCGVSDRLQEAGAVFATVASDSLERSVICADAMESRGYGTGERTDSAREPLGWDERIFAIASLLCVLALCASSLLRATGALAEPLAASLMLGAYGLLVSVPLVVNAVEDLRWLI